MLLPPSRLGLYARARHRPGTYSFMSVSVWTGGHNVLLPSSCLGLCARTRHKPDTYSFPIIIVRTEGAMCSCRLRVYGFAPAYDADSHLFFSEY